MFRTTISCPGSLLFPKVAQVFLLPIALSLSFQKSPAADGQDPRDPRRGETIWRRRRAQAQQCCSMLNPHDIRPLVRWYRYLYQPYQVPTGRYQVPGTVHTFYQQPTTATTNNPQHIAHIHICMISTIGVYSTCSKMRRVSLSSSLSSSR